MAVAAVVGGERVLRLQSAGDAGGYSFLAHAQLDEAGYSLSANSFATVSSTARTSAIVRN